VKRLKLVWQGIYGYFYYRYHEILACKIGEKRTVIEVKYLKKKRYEITLSNGYSLRLPNAGWKPKKMQDVRLIYETPLRRKVVKIKADGVTYDYAEGL
jgi:cell division septal protein FtsQ